ncbi:MAG: hypothetical protein WC495_05865 [Patescibacteria group bacterium]|jgi:hypothetical protein
MKTVKKGKEIRRVREKMASKMVFAEGWAYCPKSEYKDKVVPVSVEPEEEKEKK